jgi:hypothetical protein
MCGLVPRPWFASAHFGSAWWGAQGDAAPSYSGGNTRIGATPLADAAERIGAGLLPLDPDRIGAASAVDGKGRAGASMIINKQRIGGKRARPI